MITLIFIWIAVVSLMMLAGIIAWQVFALRRGLVDEHNHEPFSAMIQPRVDSAAFKLNVFFLTLLRQLSLKLLVGIRTLLLISKFIITKVEKRFARVISAVKGKGAIGKKGSVSLFLQEIEVARVQVRSEE